LWLQVKFAFRAGALLLDKGFVAPFT